MGNWLKRIGILSIFAFPLAVLLYRIEALGFHHSLKLIQAGAILGAVVVVISLIYAIVVRKSNPAGAKAAVFGLVVAAVPVAALMLQAKKAKDVPFIHNITTDVADAPRFYEVAKIRTDKDNPHHFDSAQKIGDTGTLGELQLKAYPKVRTLITDMPVAEALAKSEAIAKSLGWEIVSVDPDLGVVEATETTALWGFKDDVVVRVRSENGQTEVDLRSVSRFGGSDLGANAARIQTFLSKFEAQ